MIAPNLTAEDLANAHAAFIARKGEGWVPPLEECLQAARDGRLWNVDTGGSGNDCWAIADTSAEALEDVAIATDEELPQVETDRDGELRVGGELWTADAIRLSE